MSKFGVNDPAKESIAHIEALQKLINPSAQAAYIRLVLAAERAGLMTTAESTAICAVQIWSNSNLYLYSFIVNRQDLLFYIRKPAMVRDEKLEADAISKYPTIERNSAGELKVRIGDLEAAGELADWLFDR